MNNVVVCESCGTLYAAFVLKSGRDLCLAQRGDCPGLDGICKGKLTQYGHVEPWKKA
jgi:hypothetical protein